MSPSRHSYSKVTHVSCLHADCEWFFRTRSKGSNISMQQRPTFLNSTCCTGLACFFFVFKFFLACLCQSPILRHLSQCSDDYEWKCENHLATSLNIAQQSWIQQCWIIFEFVCLIPYTGYIFLDQPGAWIGAPLPRLFRTGDALSEVMRQMRWVWTQQNADCICYVRLLSQFFISSKLPRYYAMWQAGKYIGIRTLLKRTISAFYPRFPS